MPGSVTHPLGQNMHGRSSAHTMPTKSIRAALRFIGRCCSSSLKTLCGTESRKSESEKCQMGFMVAFLSSFRDALSFLQALHHPVLPLNAASLQH